MCCSSAPISTCWHVQDGLSKNSRSPDKGGLCPFGPLGADYRESESRKGSGKAAFAYRFVNCNEISVINQRFPNESQHVKYSKCNRSFRRRLKMKFRIISACMIASLFLAFFASSRSENDLPQAELLSYDYSYIKQIPN